MRHTIVFLCLIAAFSVAAEETSPQLLLEPPTLPSAVQSGENLEPELELPTIPLAVQSGESLEPEITIKRGDDGEIIHEHRVNGSIYMVKIVPSSGPAYYLVDHDGDGNMETRYNDLDKELNVPQWLLHSW